MKHVRKSFSLETGISPLREKDFWRQVVDSLADCALSRHTSPLFKARRFGDWFLSQKSRVLNKRDDAQAHIGLSDPIFEAVQVNIR
jgi:hypothetical protein